MLNPEAVEEDNLKVKLLCCAGFSSSIICSRVRKYAEENGIDMEIQADAYRSDEDYRDIDVVIVAPQIRYSYETICEELKGKNIPVGILSMDDYGMADPQKIVAFIEEVYNQNSKKKEKIMDKFQQFMEDKMLPLSRKLDSNFVITVLKNAMMAVMPVTLVGSIYLVILFLPYVSNYYPTWFTKGLTGIFGPVYNVSIPLISLYVCAAIGYFYAKGKNTNAVYYTITAVFAFLTVLPFEADGHIGTSWLGTNGMFVAMLVAFVSCWIFNVVESRNISIKLPDSVPPMVFDSFASLIPALAALTVAGIVRFAFSNTAYGSFFQFVFTALQTPIMKASTSLPFTMLVFALNQLLWFFGLHGGNIVGSVMNPIWSTALAANAAAYAAGEPLPYIITSAFNNFFINGFNKSLTLYLLLFAKSERCRAVGKVAIVPQLFNIGEPLVFGLPTVLNMNLIIPNMLVVMINACVAYFAMKTGLVPLTNGASIIWTMPVFISGFLATGSIRGALLQLVILTIDYFLFLPFVKNQDKIYLEEERQQTAD